MKGVARRLGCTEGQAYTAAIGLVLALAAALIGLPPTLRTAGAPALGSTSGQDLAVAPSPPANTDTPVDDAPAPSPSPLVPAPDRDGPAAPWAAPTSPERPSPAAADPASPPPPPPATVVATAFGDARLLARVGSPGAPDGVAVDDRGRVLVTTDNGLLRGEAAPSKVLRYGTDGRLEAELVIAGQDRARAGGLTGITVTRDGHVLVLDTAPARVLRVDLDRGSQETVAVVPDLPGDGRPQPAGLALDGDGTAYITDAGQGVIWRLSASADVSPWYVFADAEAAAGPTGIALDAAGDLLVATAVSLRESPAAGLVQRIDVRPDGAAGERTTIATTSHLSGPAGLAVADGGAVVVTLQEADEILLLGPEGDERALVTREQVQRATGLPLDGPAGIAFHAGAVVVANQAPTGDPSHWAVFVIDLV